MTKTPEEIWYENNTYTCFKCGKEFKGSPASFDPLGTAEWCDKCTLEDLKGDSK